MSKIHPFLWFDTQAEEAANLYVSVFPNSRILSVSRYPGGNPGDPDAKGKVMTVEFELDGRRIIALNGGPHFQFTEAVSFSVECEDQAEIDRYWEALLADGGKASQCGWLKDRFGFSWQIVPKMMSELYSRPDKEAVGRAYKAMMGMVKLDIAALERAYAGG